MRRSLRQTGISLYFKSGAYYIYTPDDPPVLVIGFKIFNSKAISRNLQYPFRVEVLHKGSIHQFRFKNKRKFHDSFERVKNG